MIPIILLSQVSEDNGNVDGLIQVNAKDDFTYQISYMLILYG